MKVYLHCSDTGDRMGRECSRSWENDSTENGCPRIVLAKRVRTVNMTKSASESAHGTIMLTYSKTNAHPVDEYYGTTGPTKTFLIPTVDDIAQKIRGWWLQKWYLIFIFSTKHRVFVSRSSGVQSSRQRAWVDWPPNSVQSSGKQKFFLRTCNKNGCSQSSVHATCKIFSF